MNNILITGGSGYIGRKITQNLIDRKVHNGVNFNRISIFSRSESKQAEMRRSNKDFNTYHTSYDLGDVSNYEELESHIIMLKPSVIIHAAALKMIDSVELNILNATRINIMGTYNLVEVFKKHPELNSRIVYISTDKAVEPTTAYGTSKLMSEYILKYCKLPNISVAIARYGNVLGSTSSVFDIWKKQFSDCGKVTVRDKIMTRFFWTGKSATDFVVGLCFDKREGVFVPKLEALNIFSLACYLYGEENVVVKEDYFQEKIHETMDGKTNSGDYVVAPGEHKELLKFIHEEESNERDYFRHIA